METKYADEALKVPIRQLHYMNCVPGMSMRGAATGRRLPGVGREKTRRETVREESKAASVFKKRVKEMGTQVFPMQRWHI